MGRGEKITRRRFAKSVASSGVGAAALTLAGGVTPPVSHAQGMTPVYAVRDIAVPDPAAARHTGVDRLLTLLASSGRKLHRSSTVSELSGPSGMIASDDIVLVKVNAQWKYRGCTNSDVVKGVIQRVLEHPDGFSGEVVIFENGQGSGELDCSSRRASNYPDGASHPNAESPAQHFSYLANTFFSGQSVSEYLLDPIRRNFIGPSDHSNDGYRTVGNVSYPCFTTAKGNRVELRVGLWTGSGHADRLKLINIPVLKNHGGCGMTGALKNSYGVLSMSDGQYDARHYTRIGNDCADMWCDVKTPVLTVLDCIWVSQTLIGYPARRTLRTNVLLSGFDPVALDYWASKSVLYPAWNNPYHDPDQSSELAYFLAQARNRFNSLHGGIDGRPATMNPANIVEVSEGAPPPPEGEGEGEGESPLPEGEGEPPPPEGEGECEPPPPEGGCGLPPPPLAVPGMPVSGLAGLGLLGAAIASAGLAVLSKEKEEE